MNRSTLTRWLCLAVICSLSTRALAQDAAPRLKLKSDRVVVFKDGYALIAKSGAATADADGRVFTSDVPEAAILGSFWAVGEGERILGMRAEWDEQREVRKTETACVTVGELLRANKGKRVTLGLPENRSVMGTIVEVLDLPPQDPLTTLPATESTSGGFEVVPDPSRSPFELLRSSAAERMGYHGALPVEHDGSSILRRSLSPRGGDFVVIDDTETGRLVLPIAQVQTVSGREVITKMVREEEVFTRTKRLGFDFGKDAAGKKVSLKLFYFTAGLRWIPTYRVTGDLKEEAEIALQGELVNEIEDFRDVALDLVVGVPNFRFKETVSPLTLERQLRTTLRVAEAGTGRGNDTSNFMLNAQYSNAMHQSARAENSADAGGGAMSLASELAGAQGEQDLFLYSIKSFSLKRGARATTPLWQSTVPLRHIYTMDIKPARTRAGETVLNYRGGNAHGRSSADPSAIASPLRVTVNPVWHQLELTNNSKVPWTTGAALTMRGTLPIGQDLLTYTPAGGCALLPLTVAVDLLGSFDEEEISRTPNALRVEGYDYTLVRKKGMLTVSSFRREKSAMRLSVSVGGRVEEASDDGKSRINDFRPDDWLDAGHLHVNNHSDVTWELELEPGQTKTVSYTVSFYVR